VTGSSGSGSRKRRGNIEWLPSGSARVKVYTGVDPVTKRELYLRALVKPLRTHRVSSLDGVSTSHGVPFTRDVVGRFVRDEPIQAAGAALLWSAWRERQLLLG